MAVTGAAIASTEATEAVTMAAFMAAIEADIMVVTEVATTGAEQN